MPVTLQQTALELAQRHGLTEKSVPAISALVTRVAASVGRQIDAPSEERDPRTVFVPTTPGLGLYGEDEPGKRFASRLDQAAGGILNSSMFAKMPELRADIQNAGFLSAVGIRPGVTPGAALSGFARAFTV